MSLSAEAIIALFALFVACVPGIRFALNRRDQICRWWARDQGMDYLPLPVSVLPANLQCGLVDNRNRPGRPENNHLSSLLPHLTVQFDDSRPLSTNSDNGLQCTLFKRLYTLLRRHDPMVQELSPRRLETGLLFYSTVGHVGYKALCLIPDND